MLHFDDVLKKIAILLAIAFVILTDIKVFESWEQVSALWEMEASPFVLIGHPHFFRYVVAYPGFILEAIWPSVGFSIYIGLFFSINLLLFKLIFKRLYYRRPSFLIYGLFVCAHFLMNGRGAIAWTGWLLCIWICAKINQKKTQLGSQLFWIALSCWLSAVSTGVFIIVALTFVIFILPHLLKAVQINWTKKIARITAGLILIFVAYDYFIVAVEKNLEFYGGGIQGAFNMLEHGLGVFLIEFDLMFIFVFIPICILLLIITSLATFGRSLTMLERMIGLCLFGGLFGFTVLTLVIPVLLLRMDANFTQLTLFRRARRY